MARSPRVVTSKAELAELLQPARVRKQSIGLVPTMGALHAGHLSLVQACNERCGTTVVSIFVNPAQFGPNEDFQKYPRTLDRDCILLAETGADFVYAPPTEEVYPPGATTLVDVGPVARRWEGEFRPGHFQGVATVVLKLFIIVQPDVAFFGAKDYQQTLVIKQLTNDMLLPVAIDVRPIVREADGLALSSRNVYLSPAERKRALGLSRALGLAQCLVTSGQKDAALIKSAMELEIRRDGNVQIDYVALADPHTLQPLTEITGPAMALIAARVGSTRLIDNCQLMPPANP